MSNYSPRFTSIYKLNHLFFDSFRFISGYRLYRFDSTTNRITKTTIRPSLLNSALSCSILSLKGVGDRVAWAILKWKQKMCLKKYIKMWLFQKVIIKLQWLRKLTAEIIRVLSKIGRGNELRQDNKK